MFNHSFTIKKDPHKGLAFMDCLFDRVRYTNTNNKKELMDLKWWLNKQYEIYVFVLKPTLYKGTLKRKNGKSAEELKQMQIKRIRKIMLDPIEVKH